MKKRHKICPDLRLFYKNSVSDREKQKIVWKIFINMQ